MSNKRDLKLFLSLKVMELNINKISQILSHPFSLLIVGAIISSLIIPYYTKSWQDYQKELEIKSDIASEISQTMTDYVINGRLVQMPGFMNQIDYTASTIEWEISKSVIKSKIQSYFNNLHLIKTWDNLTFYLTEFASLQTGISKEYSDFDNKLCIRIKHVLNIYEYLSTKSEEFANLSPLNINITEYNNCKYIYEKQYSDKYFSNSTGNINWNILIHKEFLHNIQTQREYLSSWLELERIFDREKNEFIILILNTPIFVV